MKSLTLTKYKMKFIWYLINREIITSAQGRFIEIFIYWVLISLFIGILDNLSIILDGGEIEWKYFFITFGITTSQAIITAIQKHLRDLKAQL